MKILSPFLISNYFVSTKGCPDGWGEYGDSCYHQVLSPKVNQFDAQTHCQSIHQDCSLVKIDNHDEQAFLESFFGESCADWIGLLGEVRM